MIIAFQLVLLVLGYVVAPVTLIWGWVRWAMLREPRTVWSLLSLTGFTLSTTSALLAVGAAIYAQIQGFRYYDPSLLRVFAWGSLLSVSGTVFGLAGLLRKNSLRWHAPLSALATLAFWIAAAAGE